MGVSFWYTLLYYREEIEMAYITPNSTVKLLRNCPLDKSQRDTWYFTTHSEQRTYFESLVMVTFTAQSYQRVKRNVIRLQYNANQLYSCNYMMFINTAYNPTKWFYAFVDGVEYINDNTCNVYYTIDVIQTWFFEYRERPCFIQRMSVADDTLGNNIEPEPITLPELVTNGVEILDNLEPVVVVVEQLQEGDEYLYFENTMMANRLILCRYNMIGGLQDIIQTFMADNPNDFIDMHMCLLPGGDIDQVTHSGTGDKLQTITKLDVSGSLGGFSNSVKIPTDVDVNVNTTRLQGYKPYNNKLYTYPYNFLNIFTADGQSMTLRYEYFDGELDGKYINITGNVLAPACVRAYPQSYKNTGNGDILTYKGENISLVGFPSCSWSVDAFTSWLAQNSVPIALQTVSAVGQLAMSAAATAYGGAATGVTEVVDFRSTRGKSYMTEKTTTKIPIPNEDVENTKVINKGINSATDVLTQGYAASLANEITKGSYQNGSYVFSANNHHFFCTRMSVPNTTAYRIDQYFDAFGYAINAIATPQRYNRKRYTYVQTKNCLIDGDLPASDRTEIEGIYDEGIRFWKYGMGDLGTYVLSDNPTL